MKNTCRRLFGLLMVLVMVSVSADFPVVSGQTTTAIADAESATVQDAGSVEDNSADTDRDSEKQPASVRYAYLSELLSQYFAGTKDGSGNDDPSAVLEERWTGLTKEEQNLFVLLKDGTWEFVRSNTGEIIGAREKTFEVDLASGDGNAEIPGAAVTEPEKDIPVINIEDPAIDVTPDVPDADNVPEIPDTADIADLPDNLTDELPESVGDLILDDLPEQDSFADLADTADIDDTVDPDMADAPEEPVQDPVDGADIPDTDDQEADADSEEPVIPDEADVDADADNADEPDAADEQDGENVPAETEDSDDAEEQDEEDAPAIADADENDTDKTELDEDNNQEEADSADSDTAEQEEKADDKAEEPDADTDDTDEFRAVPKVGAVRRGAEPTDGEETETIISAVFNYTSGIYNGEDQKTKCTSWTIKTAEDSILVLGTDYTVNVTDAENQDADKVINAGTYTTTWELTDSGKEKFTIGKDVATAATYTIEKRTITSAAFTCDSIVFDGENHIDEVRAGWTFTYGDNSDLKLKEGTDYVVEITDNNGATERVVDAGEYTISWELTGNAAKNYDDSGASLQKSATYSILQKKTGIDAAEFTIPWIIYDEDNHINEMKEGWIFKNNAGEQINLDQTDYVVTVYSKSFTVNNATDIGEYTVIWRLTDDGLDKYELSENIKTYAKCEIKKGKIWSAVFKYSRIPTDGEDHYAEVVEGWTFQDPDNNTIALRQGNQGDYTVKVYKDGAEVNSVKDEGKYRIEWTLTNKGKRLYEINNQIETEAECEIKRTTIKSAEFNYALIPFDNENHFDDLVGGWTFKDSHDRVISLVQGEEADYTVEIKKDGIVVESAIDEGTYYVKWSLTKKGESKYKLRSGITKEAICEISKTEIRSAEFKPVNIAFDGKDHKNEMIGGWVFKDSNWNEITLVPEEDYSVEIKKDNADVESAINEGTYYVKWSLTEKGERKYKLNYWITRDATCEIRKIELQSAVLKKDRITFDGEDHYNELINSWIFRDSYWNEVELTEGEQGDYIVEIRKNGEKVETVRDVGRYVVSWHMTDKGGSTYTLKYGIQMEAVYEIQKTQIWHGTFNVDNIKYDGKEHYGDLLVGWVFSDYGYNEINLSHEDDEADYISKVYRNGREVTSVKEVGEYTVTWELSEKGKKTYELAYEMNRTAVFNIFPAPIAADFGLNGKKTYSGEDWKKKVMEEYVTVYMQENDNEIASKEWYTVTVAPDITEIKKVGKYTVSVQGNPGTPIAGNTSAADFYIIPAEIDKNNTTLKKLDAQYNGENWYDQITKQKLTVVSKPVKHLDGTESPIILEANEVSFDSSMGDTELIDARDDYKVYWKLNIPSNFFVEDNDRYFDYKVDKAEICQAEFVNSPIYDGEDWRDRITVGSIEGDSKNAQLIITANTVYPSEETEEKVKAGIVKLTSEDAYIPEQEEIIDAGTYTVKWKLTEKGKNNFCIIDSMQQKTAQLTIQPASVTERDIFSQDGQVKNEVIYNGTDWSSRILPGYDAVCEEDYYFVVKANAGDIPLTKDEFWLEFNPEKVINVGEYSVILNLPKEKSNYAFDEAFDNKLVFKVTPYPVLPLEDETKSVREPNKTTPVTFDGVYHMGPKQDNGARILTISGEPGQIVVVEINGKKAEFKLEGTAYSNYPDASAESKELQITFNSNGVLLDHEQKETGLRLLENEETTITLSYKNTNLREIDDDVPPASLDIKVLYDTIKPDLSEAIGEFKNRDQNVKFTAPEPGRLESIRFSEHSEPYEKVFNDVSKSYGDYVEDLPVGWNTGEVKLIQSGDNAMEVHYTDLACNETTENFAIGRSQGEPIVIKVEPITGDNRIDMGSKPEAVRVSVTGTGYETIEVSIQPSNNSYRREELIAGSGNWARNSCKEIPLEVNTNIFPDNAEITVTARYKDLVNSDESISFYFDETADAMVMTMPQVTEDNWVISGIAEPGSTVEVYVNGERVSNRVFDSYTIFTARQPQMEVGDTVRIVATDLSGNRSEATTTIEAGPSNGKQVMGAYAMGKVYTDAHTNKENPGWMMAGLYTEEELLAGVKVPLVAANAFHIGEVSLQLKDGKPEYSFIPADGVELSGQHIDILPAENKTFSYTKYQKELAEGTGTEGQKIGYWVVASAEAEIPVELLHNSFHLDEEQEDIRALYFNRQRLNTLPTDEQP